jgi:hypothetical protein
MQRYETERNSHLPTLKAAAALAAALLAVVREPAAVVLRLVVVLGVLLLAGPMLAALLELGAFLAVLVLPLELTLAVLERTTVERSRRALLIRSTAVSRLLEAGASPCEIKSNLRNRFFFISS